MAWDNRSGFQYDVAGRDSNAQPAAQTSDGKTNADESKEFKFSDWFAWLKPEKKPENTSADAKKNEPDNKSQTTETQASQGSVSPALAEARAAVAASIADRVTRAENIYINFIDVASNSSDCVIPKFGKSERNGINIPREIFEDMKAFREENKQELINRMVNIYEPVRVGKNGVVEPPNERVAAQRSEDLRVEMSNRMQEYVKKKHIDRGGASEEVLNKELHGAFNLVNQTTPSRGGMLDSLTQSIYDPLKGGLQLGGIGGALIGFFLGSALVPEGMGWMGMLAKVLMIGAFVYAGNKTVDYMETKTKFGSDKNGVVKEKEKTPPQTEQQIKKDKDEPAQGQSQGQSQDKKPSTSINPSDLPLVGSINVSGGEDVNVAIQKRIPLQLSTDKTISVATNGR